MAASGLAIALVLAASASPAQESAQVFPTRVELVAVEILVVDDDGGPLRDLGPADFRVEVAGEPRRVVTAEYVSVLREGDEPPAAGAAGFTTNASGRSGRLVLLVVDTSNIELGAGRDQVEAAERMLDRLHPTDRVGLLTIPSSGPREDFSTDHERIRVALAKVAGRWHPNRRRLALVEALSGGEASASPGEMERERWAAAVRRECGGDEACGLELRAEAWQITNEYRQTSASARALLRATFEALRPVEGQKVVILVSQGLGFPEMGGQVGSGGIELRELVTAATTAHVVLYVVPVRGRVFNSDVPMLLQDEDRRLHAAGLEMLATDAGATILKGSPKRAFERILSETSGYYRIGFEPQGDDRDGKARKLRVTVARKGAIIRARPLEVFRPPASPAEARGDLVAALRSPTVATNLPLRVATWSLAGAEPGTVRLLIGAEIAGEADPHGLVVGYVLLDTAGKVVTSASQPLRDDAPPPQGPLPYSASATVAPGAYTLRLAVRDGRGRLGSVHHKLEAGLVEAGELQLSDLLLGPAPPPGQAFRPAVVPPSWGGAASSGGATLVRVEVYGKEGPALESAEARLEIVSDETGATVRSADADLTAAGGPGRRLVQIPLPLDGLAPGHYLARLVVSIEGTPRGAVVRPFRLAAQPSAGIAP